ncbi:hypothetical protein Tco_0808131 [Tanacetum coccineum]
MPMDDLLHEVPKLISRIDSLETDLKQTKLTMGNAIVKLVKKVKKLEGFLRRRNLVLSDTEEEEPEVQGRKSQDDPLDFSVQGLVTPPTTKVNTASAEQVSTAEGVNTGSIKLSTVSEQVSTGNEQVSTVGTKESTSSQDKGQRERGEELQTKTSKKRLKDDETKDDDQRTKKSEKEDNIWQGKVAYGKWFDKNDYEIQYEVVKQRRVCHRYGMDGPEDELEKGFWKCLKTMFEEPLSTDPIWSELGQQKIIRVNTPGSDENRLKLYDLMYIIVNVADMMDC